MLFSSLVALSLAGGALTGPYKRFDGLTVKLSGPTSAVSSVDDLKFIASVTNNGVEDVKVLKYATILDSQLPTKSFKVTKDGKDVPFTGIKISVSLADVDDSAFAVIPAGQTVTVSHKVAPLYDFASAGAGKFAFEPLTTFQVQAAAEKLVAGELSKRELPLLNKRAVDICSNGSEKSFLDASYSEGKSLATQAVSYISSHGSDTLFKSYFGASSTSRVSSILSAVANENSSSRTLSCTDSFGGCSSGVIAYTVISTTNIYVCSIFFSEVTTSRLCSGTSVASRNIRGGTILHELTHAVGGTDDITYGCSADQALSDTQSVENADNYNCFTTQVYANTQC